MIQLANRVMNYVKVSMLFLFKEFNFEIVVKPRRLNASPYHILRLETGEDPISLDDNIPSARFFAVKMVDNYYANIVYFLATGSASEGFSTT